MEIINCAVKGDSQGLRKLLDKNISQEINYTSKEDGRTALHYVVANGNHECMQILLSQANIDLDIQDYKGDTALHLAAALGDLEAVKLLVSFGPNLFQKNNASQKVTDVAKPGPVEVFLTDRAGIAKASKQWKRSHLISLETELPSDAQKLRDLCLDTLINQCVFEERCREALKQLIEEKHVAMHQNRLLEQAAGIPDKETGERYIGQLSYLQDENEKLSTSVSFLKSRIQLLESQASQQEEYYKSNLNEMTRQQKDQVEAIFKRAEETEKSFLDFQKKYSEELAKANQVSSELQYAKNGPASDEVTQLRKELFESRKQIGELSAEKMTLEQRFKLADNLKSLGEKELTDLKLQIESLRKNTTENAIAQIEQVQKEQEKKDEKDESAGDIVFIKGEGGQRGVKAGTEEKLVERLLDPSAYDNQYQQAFLMTHPVYMDSVALLKKIIEASHVNTAAVKAALPEGAPVPSTSPMLLRIVNTLKIWVDQYWIDFSTNEALMDTLTGFVDSIENPKLVQMLKTAITRKLTGTEATVIEVAAQFPKPVLPKFLVRRYEKGSSPKKSTDTLEDIKVKLMDLDPLEVARQLTLLEFQFYTEIRAREFLDMAWMKDDKEQKAPNIIKMVRWSNHVIHWLVTEIVTVKDNLKQRAALMEKIIAIGQNLEKLNNFNGVKEVLAALQSSAVYRLKKTREAVGSKYLKAYEEMKKMTSSELNYKALRAKVHGVEPPLIPFPGVYQGDLVFLETCGKTRIENNLVNFQKFQKISSYVVDLQTYQKVPYQLGPVIEIQDMIKSYPELDDDQAYAMSLICEPRQAQ